MPTPSELLPAAQGIGNLVSVLKKRGVAVYLISGSFREFILPIAKHLGVPKENVFANRMNWCVRARACVRCEGGRAGGGWAARRGSTHDHPTWARPRRACLPPAWPGVCVRACVRARAR